MVILYGRIKSGIENYEYNCINSLDNSLYWFYVQLIKLVRSFLRKCLEG